MSTGYLIWRARGVQGIGTYRSVLDVSCSGVEEPRDRGLAHGALVPLADSLDGGVLVCVHCVGLVGVLRDVGCGM